MPWMEADEGVLCLTIFLPAVSLVIQAWQWAEEERLEEERGRAWDVEAQRERDVCAACLNPELRLQSVCPEPCVTCAADRRGECNQAACAAAQSQVGSGHLAGQDAAVGLQEVC